MTKEEQFDKLIQQKGSCDHIHCSRDNCYFYNKNNKLKCYALRFRGDTSSLIFTYNFCMHYKLRKIKNILK